MIVYPCRYGVKLSPNCQLRHKDKMSFEENFQIVARKTVPVKDGLDFYLGRGNFGRAYLVKEKKGPWNNR